MSSLLQHNKNKDLNSFVLRIIDECQTIKQKRLKLLLFLGETIYMQKTNGSTMGDGFYQFDTGIWSTEIDDLIDSELPNKKLITVENEFVPPYREPVTQITKQPNELTNDAYNYEHETSELASIVVDATMNKSMTELKFWFDHSVLGSKHNTGDGLTQGVIKWYVNGVSNNEIIPEWSKLI